MSPDIPIAVAVWGDRFTVFDSGNAGITGAKIDAEDFQWNRLPLK